MSCLTQSAIPTCGQVLCDADFQYSAGLLTDYVEKNRVLVAANTRTNLRLNRYC
jgi:hypothetical protein